MAFMEIKIRSFNEHIDRARVEDFERKCEIGPTQSLFLFTDTMGDPICRIRNSPQYKMLVAESKNELIGIIQGSIKIVTVRSSSMDQAKVGYILGLRVSPSHRRRGIGSSLVRKLEAWFISNHVDFAYMATEKDNEASVKLFTEKLGFVKFRTPTILVNPVGHRAMSVSPNVVIAKLSIEQTERLYRRFMGSTEFFPNDIGQVLRNKLSLGTWVGYPRDESWTELDPDKFVPSSWAMLSVWNSGDLFKLRVGKASISCFVYSKGSRLINRVFPCLKIPALPDFSDPFGFYFMYGVYSHGPKSGELVRSLCRFVHNMGIKCKDCKVIVTEVGECDTLRLHIPHRKSLSCTEDLWCIKTLKNQEKQKTLFEMTRTPLVSRALFVDPREV